MLVNVLVLFVGLAFVLGIFAARRATERQLSLWMPVWLIVLVVGALTGFYLICPGQVLWIGKIPFCR